jgi:hypothetical protein
VGKAMSMPRYANPVGSGARSVVSGAVRGSQTMAKIVDSAANRKLKLDSALGKFRGK